MKTLKIILLNIFLIGIFLSVGAIIPTKEKAKAQNPAQFPFGFAEPSAPDDPIKLSALGAKYARESISWQMIEPTDNNFDFSIFDQPGLVEQYGLELIARLKLGNNATPETANWWGTSCDLTLCDGVTGRECPSASADCPPTDIDTQPWDSNTGYSPTATDVVTRTLEEVHNRGKNIEYIVVGNEVNSWVFWHGTTEQYLKTRTTIYNAVKKVNARLGTSYKVTDNGIAGTIWSNAIAYEAYCQGDVPYAIDFANRAADHILARDITEDDFRTINCNDIGGRDYKILKSVFQKDPNLNEPSFDLMAYHFYEPWDVQEEVINWARQEMINNGYQPRPLINTEGGYRDTLHLYSDTPSLAQDIANDIPKIHTIAFSNGVKAWLWLPFTERLTGKFYGPQWKGLVKEDQLLLPSFTSYKTMVEKINGFSSIENITGTGAGYVYKVNLPNKNPVYVIWDKTSKTVNLSLLISGSVKMTHVDGTSQIVSSQSVNISDSPIYLEELPLAITLRKQVDKTSTNIGVTLTYTLTYTNNTANQITNARIEDPIPPGTTFLSATNGGTSDGTKVIWNVGTVSPGAGGTVSFQVRVN